MPQNGKKIFKLIFLTVSIQPYARMRDCVFLRARKAGDHWLVTHPISTSDPVVWPRLTAGGGVSDCSAASRTVLWCAALTKYVGILGDWFWGDCWPEVHRICIEFGPICCNFSAFVFPISIPYCKGGQLTRKKIDENEKLSQQHSEELITTPAS